MTDARSAPGDEELPVESVNVEVRVVGIKKLSKESRINVILSLESSKSNAVSRHSAARFIKTCDVHEKRGYATVSFQDVVPEVNYRLVVCHTGSNRIKCTMDEEGQPKEAGVAQVIQPLNGKSPFTVNVNLGHAYR